MTDEELADAIKSSLPRYDIFMSIEHNRHKVYYETVERYMPSVGSHDWVCDGEYQRAIDTDEIWQAQWYPDTPIGSFDLCAATLPALLKGLREFDDA